MCGISIRPGKVWKWWTRLAPVVALASGSAAMAAPTVLDFEDIAASTTIREQYGPRGVIFQNAFLRTDPAAHSGTRVLQVAQTTSDHEFDPGPMVITFTSEQRRVKLFAGTTVAGINHTLKAFDANGTLLGQDGPKVVTAGAFTTSFEIQVNGNLIDHVEFLLVGGGFEAIDDLEFDGKAPATVPTTPPVVQITSPANGAALDVDAITIAGTVTGDGLLSPVTMTMASLRPPEQSSAPPITSVIALTGTGTTRQFSLPISGVPLGPITITVTAANIGALKGTASITFTNFPVEIVERFMQDGATGTFGAFRFGLSGFLAPPQKEGDPPLSCTIAVYEQGAISTDGANTLVIRGRMFTKWLLLRQVRISPSPSDDLGLGCPLDEETVGPLGSRIQNFRNGRIYAEVVRVEPPPDLAGFYVPNVFLNVLDGRELEPASLPLADPVSPIEPVQTSTQTHLFQQFIRAGRPDLLPATLEIQGSPPILWVERQPGIASTAQTGALWEHFSCSGNLGPCEVEEPPTFDTIKDAGEQFCGGTAIRTNEGEYSIFGTCGAPQLAGIDTCGRREWTPIKGVTPASRIDPLSGAPIGDDYLQTSIYGVIMDSHLAGEDFTGSHTWCAQTPFDFNHPSTFADPSNYLNCISDWNIIVAPIGPQPGVAPFPSLIAEGNEVSGIGRPHSSSSRLVELEYERFYGDFVETWMGRPAVGDLFFGVGRWIVDCGHPDFHTELHPLYMYAKMKTVTSITDFFTGLVNENPFGGQPATRADIWVNGWYPGGDDADHAIEFDIYPPPRPTPTARLVVNKPVDADAVHDVTIQYSFLSGEHQIQAASNHVHVKFTAPFRQNHVSVWGEVQWEINRGYEGQWYVFWDTSPPVILK